MFTDLAPKIQSLFPLFISRLVCVSSERLGNNGVDDFRPHPFFEGIDWDNILESTSSYL